MSRDHLRTASERLESAADAASAGTADRLDDVADQLASLAERETGPDHGRLARIQSTLADLQSDAADDVAATIDEADDAINAYRETLEGV